jgi:uncharacterized Zn finger protein
METLARETGDVEALVAVKKRDLSMPYGYLQIAETYRAARKHDLALEWAERGLAAFPQRRDSRLVEFLAAEYHRRKRHDEALALIWAEFVDSPDLEHYRLLKEHAGKSGAWPSWREKALEHLREARAKGPKTRGTAGIWARDASSELVQVFLWEKDAQAAWREAQAGGCSEALWMELAKRREQDHPQDALPIYRRQIEPILRHMGNDAYREAVQMLRRIRGVLVRLGREAEFAAYLQSLRAVHKPKRNFIKLLDHARW